MTPDELIWSISQHIDRGEINHDPYAFVEARRLLNNVLPKAIEEYATECVKQAAHAVQKSAAPIMVRRERTERSMDGNSAERLCLEVEGNPVA